MYFSHQTMQVPRVARQCIASLCEGAAEAGAEVELVSFTTKLHASEGAHPPFEELYDIKTPVQHRAYALVGFPLLGKFILLNLRRLIVYVIHALRSVIKGEAKAPRILIVSARNKSILCMLALLKRLVGRRMVVIADAHGFPDSSFMRGIFRAVDGVMCISKSLADDTMKSLRISEKNIRFAHGGVKVERYDRITATKDILRNALELPLDKTILCYSGKVYYRYEEVAYLLDAAKSFDDSVLFLILGGREDQLPPWQEEVRLNKLKNVCFKSFVSPSNVPKYLKAADLLLSYYPPSKLNAYRSPTKLFEYLASGTPLVIGRERSIEEIVRDGENGFLVQPYKPTLLAERIKYILPLLTNIKETISYNARQTAQAYSWKRRAEAFLDFALKLSGTN